MEYFATTTLPELATVLGVVFSGFAALLLGFYKFAQWQSTQAQGERAEERKDLTKALHELTKSNQAIADATNKSAREAEQRNGHLAELTTQHGEKMIEAIAQLKNQNVKEQHVEHQTVEHQTVEHQTVEHKE